MLKQFIVRLILLTFSLSSIGPFPDASAQVLLDLPAPGMMVNKSDPFEPLQLKGILVNVKNPLRFDFLLDKGDSALYGQPLKSNITRLAKYFLTCLAVPESDLWVNLSPYEKDRIVPGNFGVTLMGRDLLEQDYLLKQMMASLSYPENELGRRFWQKVYRRSYELYGTTDIPINTFNKVWIIPKSADVYVQGNAAFVVNSRLDVMLEADYRSFIHHMNVQGPVMNHQGLSQKAGAYSQVLKDVILPELREEVNEGKNFAVVRQVYNAMILATWYKRHLKDSLLGRMYVGRNQVSGVDIADKKAKEKIYQLYLQAYKKCVYNYIKEDYDPATGQTVPRKYASGGMYFVGFGGPGSVYDEVSSPQGMGIGSDLAMATVDVSARNTNGQEIVTFPDKRAEITNTHPFHIERDSPQNGDRAMISPRISSLARKILLPLAALVAISVSTPAFGAVFTPNPGHNSMQVTVEANDTFGDIVMKAGYTAPLWGPGGNVAKVAGLVKDQVPDITHIHSGQTFDIPNPVSTVHSVSADITNVAPPQGITGDIIPLAHAIGDSVGQSAQTYDLGTALQDAKDKVVSAADKGTVRLYIEGGDEVNPTLRYIGLGIEFRTPLLIDLDKAHEKREAPLDEGFAKAARGIHIRGSVYDLIAEVKEYDAIKDDISRLQSVNDPGLANEIAQANEAERHQLSLITQSLVIPLNDLPAGSTVAITDAEMDLGGIEAAVNAQGVEGQPQTDLANFTLEKAVEGVRGNLDLSGHKFKKAIPSHVTIHINPTSGMMGGGVIGWLIGYITPEWKVYPKFDAQAQADSIKGAVAVWRDARLSIYRQLKQTLLDLYKDQNDLTAARQAWDARGNETDIEKLAAMSQKITALEEKVSSEQLTAMKMGMSAEMVDRTASLTQEAIDQEVRDFVQGAFQQGVEDLRSQVNDWKGRLEAHQKNKNVPVILEALNGITASMELPLKDEDIQGLPDNDATGGAAANGFTITEVHAPIVSYTTGTSSNSPDAPTFITGLNYGGTETLNIKTGTSKKTRDLQRQMQFAQQQYAAAQQGQGDGPKEFRQAIYGYLTSSIAQEIVSSGQGFNFTQMLAYYRTTTAHDNYTVFSPTSFDPLHLIMKGINKLRHKGSEQEASDITAQALVDELKLQLKEDMFQARADTSKGLRWQAWNSFINGEDPFINGIDTKGVACGEFASLLQSLRQELKPLWESGPPPDQRPIAIQLIRLHLDTANKMLGLSPDAVAYWTAPVVVRVGSSTGPSYWEGIRSGVTIDWADKLRFKHDAEIQIWELQQELNRAEADWQRAQAAEEGQASASLALASILARQIEEGPTVIEAPQASWEDIANAVAMAQPIGKELAALEKNGKDPRTILVNILASAQVHPQRAEELLAGVSFDLIDWVRRARIEEVSALLAKLRREDEIDSITSARRVMDLFAQEQFAVGAFQTADTDLKSAMSRGQDLQPAQSKYLSARTQLETVSRRLNLGLSVLDEKEQRGFSIDRVRLLTAPILPQLSVEQIIEAPLTLPAVLPKHHIKKKHPPIIPQVVQSDVPQETAKIIPPPPAPVLNNRTANKQVIHDLKDHWSLFLGSAILGIGLLAGFLGYKKYRKAIKNNPPSIPSQSLDRSDEGFLVAGDQGPALPDADEMAWANEPRTIPVYQAQANTPAQTQQPLITGLRIMDVLSLALATGLSAFHSGGDIRTVGIAVLVTFLATRIFYAAQLWLHEIGHTLTALVQSPKDFKKILTTQNISGGYGLGDWLRAGSVFGRPSHNAGVELPLTGLARRVNQAVGFAVSTAISVITIGLALRFGPSSAFLAPMLISSLFMFINSFVTDIWKPSPDGKIECGDSGYIWLPKEGVQGVEGFFPAFVKAGLKQMHSISSLRGDQGKGEFTWGETGDEDVVPIIFKAMKSKRGNSVADEANKGFEDEIKAYLKKGITPLSGGSREIMSHDRFLTQGVPSQQSLHPHLGVIEKRTICYFDNGVYQKRPRTIVSVVIENGDNDAHEKHGQLMPTRKIREFYPRKFRMEKDVYIAPNAENPKGYYDYLPSGDAPPLALEVQWADNQGDWTASSRYAVDEVFYESNEESMEQNLSEAEEQALGDLFMSVYEHGHEQVLIRPKLNKRNKSLADLWVTESMVQEYPQLAFQYNALNDFRADLKRSFLTAPKTSAVGALLLRLQNLHPQEGLEQKIGRFVDMTVERFFTADILQAAIEIDRRTQGTGTYSVRELSSKYPQRGVFWTRGQSLSLGENTQAGYLAYNSEHTALMGNSGEHPPVKQILFLNSEGQGQLTETFFDNDNQRLVLRAYSPEKGRFLTEDELKESRMELEPDNEYFTALVERDPKALAEEDIAEIPKAINDTSERWEEPNSFVRQSADELFNKMASRYVEHYIRDNSRFYKVMQGNLLFDIEKEAAGYLKELYSDDEANARLASLVRLVQQDHRILLYLKARLDRMVSDEADMLSTQIISGDMNQDDLYSQLKDFDLRLSRRMKAEIKVLTVNLVSNNAQFLSRIDLEIGPTAEGRDLPDKESIGSGDADFIAVGLEDSLWIGSENLKQMLLTFFPQMKIVSESANKALDLKPNDHYQVGRRTIAMVVSKSGATSPTKNLLPILKNITPGNIFAMTGRVDTLIGLSLGQRYYKGAPFGRRIFPTGNYYPSEVNSVSEVELLFNQIEMVLYIVKRMKETFPDQRPWGMDVSDQNIKKLEKWRDGMLKRSVNLTGIDEDGNPGQYKANKEILKNGRIFGNMLTETPLVNLGFRAYVFGIIFLGTPIGLAAAYVQSVTGLSVHTSIWGHLLWAAMDTIVACSMPWWLTTGIFRKFSGRLQGWARMGPPKVTIGDVPVLNQVIEVSASKRGAMAIGSMDADYHGGNAQDHFGPRFIHRVRRGSILIFGIPEDPHARGDVLMTVNQSNIETDLSSRIKIWRKIGSWFKAGPEIFTIGHGNVDPNLSQHHMDIGQFDTVNVDKDGLITPRKDVTETLGKFYAQSFEVLDRLIAYNVFFNEAYRKATKWGPFRVWKPWESISKTGVLSTPSPRSGPVKKLKEYIDHDQEIGPLDASAGDNPPDAAQVASRDGGINMDSRLMRLKVTGETNRIWVYDNERSGPMIQGVAPQVLKVVPVTPDMLKAMLGPN